MFIQDILLFQKKKAAWPLPFWNNKISWINAHVCLINNLFSKYSYILFFELVIKICVPNCNFMVFNLRNVPWFAFFVLLAWQCNHLKHKVLPISFPQPILLDWSIHHYQVKSIHLLSEFQKWFLDPWSKKKDNKIKVQSL